MTKMGGLFEDEFGGVLPLIGSLLLIVGLHLMLALLMDKYKSNERSR